jgi:hypothetical protein
MFKHSSSKHKNFEQTLKQKRDPGNCGTNRFSDGNAQSGRCCNLRDLTKKESHVTSKYQGRQKVKKQLSGYGRQVQQS